MRAEDVDGTFYGSSQVNLISSARPSVIPDAPVQQTPLPPAQPAPSPPSSSPPPPPPRPESPTQHPAGLPPPPQGRLDIPPGAYVYTGPPLPPNTLGRAEWLPDETVPNCMRCGEEFNFFLRRHHCRQCGQIFCHRCCNSKALLQPDSGTDRQARAAAHWFFGEQETDALKPQKVCGKCFDLLLPMQPYLTATGSKAVQEPDFADPSWKVCGRVALARESIQAGGLVRVAATLCSAWIPTLRPRALLFVHPLLPPPLRLGVDRQTHLALLQA